MSHLTGFLQPALLNGWCRLSVRQVPSLRDDHLLSWSVYLTTEKASPNHVDPPADDSELPRDSPGPKV